MPGLTEDYSGSMILYALKFIQFIVRGYHYSYHYYFFNYEKDDDYDYHYFYCTKVHMSKFIRQGKCCVYQDLKSAENEVNYSAQSDMSNVFPVVILHAKHARSVSGTAHVKATTCFVTCYQ